MCRTGAEIRFSAQPRADGDEAVSGRICPIRYICFSAQPRADGDEAVSGRVWFTV